MSESKIFLILTNIFSLNFSRFVLPVFFVAILQVFLLIYGFYMLIYLNLAFYVENMKHVTIYTIMNIFQVEVFYVLQVIYMLRALTRKKLTKEILDSIFLMNINRKKIERKFIANFAIIVLVRILKILSSFSSFYMIKMMFAEITMATSDFVFEFYTSALIENCKEIKEKLKLAKDKKRIDEIRRKILQNFHLKRKINKRLSVELFMSITYNYFQVIVSFYWFFMRIKFDRLNNLHGEHKQSLM